MVTLKMNGVQEEGLLMILSYRGNIQLSLIELPEGMQGNQILPKALARAILSAEDLGLKLPGIDFYASQLEGCAPPQPYYAAKLGAKVDTFDGSYSEFGERDREHLQSFFEMLGNDCECSRAGDGCPVCDQFEKPEKVKPFVKGRSHILHILKKAKEAIKKKDLVIYKLYKDKVEKLRCQRDGHQWPGTNMIITPTMKGKRLKWPKRIQVWIDGLKLKAGRKSRVSAMANIGCPNGNKSHRDGSSRRSRAARQRLAALLRKRAGT